MATTMAARAAGRLARFQGYDVNPGTVRGLAEDHPAVVEARTLFPGNVKATALSARFLISGANNAKIGRVVTKGPWQGYPIYTLTLEERATCPRSCAQWLGCYANSMQWPSRWDHRDPLFLDTLRAEIITVCRANPKGLVVRLHVLGDFFSTAYVQMWAEMVDRFPQLHIYGYTARRDDADDEESRQIARALRWLTEQAFDQFALRFSRPEPGPGHSIVVDVDPQESDVIICPAQTHATETCGTCGLCWAPAARGKTIAFLRHGLKMLGPASTRSPKSPKKPKPLAVDPETIQLPEGIAGPFGKTTLARFLRLYYAGEPLGNLQDLAGVSRQRMFQVLKLWGLPARASGLPLPTCVTPPQRKRAAVVAGRGALRRSEPSDPGMVGSLTVDEVVKRYLAKEAGGDIASAAGVRAHVVYDRLRAAGVVIRPARTGRPIIGGLHGETAVDRDRRIMGFMREHPELDAVGVSTHLGVPFTACDRLARDLRAIEKEEGRERPVFLPPIRFTPSARRIAETAEERIAAIPQSERDAIEARYGAVIRKVSA